MYVYRVELRKNNIVNEIRESQKLELNPFPVPCYLVISVMRVELRLSTLTLKLFDNSDDSTLMGSLLTCVGMYA